MEGDAKSLNQKTCSTAGQTLIELLLALGIFAFIMTAVFALVFGGLTTGLRTEEQDYATMYAKEGLDAARSIRDTNWDSFAQSGTHGVANSGTGWSWNGTNNEIIYGARKLTREIFVEDVYRDASNNIFTGSNSANFDYTNNTDYQCEGGACPSANIDNIAGTAQLKKKILSTNPHELTADANTKALYHFNETEVAGDGKIFYSISGNTTPQTKDYNRSANSFGSAVSTASGAAAIQSVVKASPVKNELIAGYVDSSGNLQVMCYDGTIWTNEWSINVGGTGTTRRFDVAYEINSGDAIILYSTNIAATNELAYRTKLGTAGCGTANWSSAVNLDPVRTSGIVQWVKMAVDRRITSNLITAIWADANSDLSAMVWSGAVWGNEPSAVTESNLEVVSAAQDVDNFDVEYESLSGDVMVVWGTSVAANVNGAWYRTCTGGTASCTWNAVTTPPTWADEVHHVGISANPNTDEIVFASLALAENTAGSADLQAGYWSGSAWTNTANLDVTSQLPTAGTKFVATGWLIAGATTRSVVIYYNSATTAVHGYIGNGGTFTRQGGADPASWFTPTPAFGVQTQYKIEMNPINKDRLMFLVSDANSDIFAKQLVMTSTPTFTGSNADGGAALEINTASATYKTFDFVYNNPIAADSSGNNNKGNLNYFISPNGFVTGNTNLNQALQFDGTDDYVGVGNVGAGIKSVEFWINNTDSDASDGILELIDNSAYVSIASGAISATGFTSPTIYVDGNSASATLGSGWHHVAIVTNTAINAASVRIGEANNNYFSGNLDEVAIWDKVLTQQDIWDHIGANVGYQTNSYATVKYNPNPPGTPNKDTLYIDRFKELVETATKPAGTSVDYQLSTDNCSTMKYWDGSQWTAAGGWNDIRTINRYFDQITPSSTICLSARLNTTDANQTPVLDNAEIKYMTNRNLAATLDPHTKRVTSRVKWPSGFSFQDVTLSEYMTDWMYPEIIHDTQADFSAVEGSTAGLTLDANGTIYLLNTPSGPITYTHAAIDLGNKSKILKLQWNATKPASGTLSLQIRSADSQANLASAPWCGQTACNGTDTYTITGNGNSSVIVTTDNQWFQYRLNFTSTVANETPVLDKITIKAKNLY